MEVIAVKMLMIPDYTRTNAYQRELQRGLQACGVDVSLSGGRGKLPIIGAIKLHGRPDVLHLHWTHGFIVAPGRFRTIIRGIRFLAELSLLRTLGVKIVWTVHNIWEHERRQPQLEFIFQRFLVMLCNHLIVFCVAAQEAVMQSFRLSERYREKIAVIPHEHYITSYPNRITREDARKKLDCSEEAWKREASEPIRDANLRKFYRLFDEEQRRYISERIATVQGRVSTIEADRGSE